MWVIQNGGLMSVPNDAPIPPNATRIALPEDFHGNRRSYKIENAALVLRSAEDLAGQPDQPGLTSDEIARIKQAIGKNLL
ncbi:MAG: hypothetical protein GC191_00865 [Azospirillum sp.]|nr:hypothetical protein [Azospirillum sp.]